MATDYGSRSDAGRIRENNEDSLCLAPEINLFVLSDGMGGQASGEVASRLATETIVAYCREALVTPSSALTGIRIAGVSDTSNRLASAIRLANRVVHQAAEHTPEQRGMGATVVAVWLEDLRMSLAHVGDSRAYCLRGETLEQLTEDHSFVAEQVRRGSMTEQEAASSKLQNVLLRALGVDPEVQVEVREHLLLEGDTILLCSDGLTRELSDAQIAAVLGEAEDAQEAADRLVDLANQAGGEDNISAIVVRHAARPAGALARMGRWFKGSEVQS
ncbi:MAG TPA: Stp1/IreP family PP2C-type Ser/Thr phosphatase [Candidatus Limnocylindria bacterium]|nr:Stp1/IreP family PP2C-type Ser/Thr phosphatase [Candidatus Limnocylindria bacterium]